jgi:hypothetical protein
MDIDDGIVVPNSTQSDKVAIALVPPPVYPPIPKLEEYWKHPVLVEKQEQQDDERDHELSCQQFIRTARQALNRLERSEIRHFRWHGCLCREHMKRANDSVGEEGYAVWIDRWSFLNCWCCLMEHDMRVGPKIHRPRHRWTLCRVMFVGFMLAIGVVLIVVISLKL